MLDLKRLRRVRDAAPQTVPPEPQLPAAQPTHAYDGIEVVTTLERLDEKLAQIDAAWSVSDDAVRAVFQTFRMEIPVEDRSRPYSDSYRAAQFALYHRISARPGYSTDNEVSGFTVDPKCPFPYYTKSASTVGDQLMAIGYLIKTMALPSGSSVLEFGPGWGNTTIALAQMGYDVTALDIDPNFVQLICDRGALFGLTPDARVGAFLDAATIDRQYDAVLFYECFHHCSDHVQLLTDLHHVVKPGGRVVLAAEPIFDGFHAPWGLRLDGESLWAIRQNGWLELGFTESYFVETCLRQGWKVDRHRSDVSDLTSLFVLTRLGESMFPGQIRLPPADDANWAIPDSPTATQRYTSGHSRLVCPVGGQWASVTVQLVNPSPRNLEYIISHGSSVESGVLNRQSHKSIRLSYCATAGEVTFKSRTWRPSELIRGSSDNRLLGLGVVTVELSKA
jgi:SAM-dependent methyltransferase